MAIKQCTLPTLTQTYFPSLNSLLVLAICLCSPRPQAFMSMLSENSNVHRSEQDEKRHIIKYYAIRVAFHTSGNSQPRTLDQKDDMQVKAH